ncbi:class I SAM-dependent DNA methyltransferase [Tengunoibacter tsumagoiensis]|uniref:site-specific DNA-methyltransferase (adenine-specific) n=1 Tax=Tengunoibacter tsumagoiensis TaxID=2014871 RepID=A0A402A050_9CHLR|nr:class I SAM-dependent DNA methyltransferase [Tengunoibacter tsumagoiensis]GCE12484.1 restriction endonuclease EcoEI subunit M [Tengunoibacter tsumagoiensis]
MVVSQQQSLFGEEFTTPPKQNEPPSSSAITPAQKRTKKVKQPLSNRQQLSATIKSVRDLLRKDAGLSGDTDRLPQLVWLLFLKNLDDYELMREEELGERYTPIVAEKYRWRDWVVGESLTHQRKGDALLSFVNDDLFPYLGKLTSENPRDLRAIIGTIFRGTYNRIRSGYILREVADKINTINFNSSDDIHAISLFYETMLKEMRDSAGDAGEFYTPRPVVRFIIDRLNPLLGETLLDPACGTAGFLVEAYTRLDEQVKTPEQRQLAQQSLHGFEKKSMSYLLAIMNLLLHGIEAPNVQERNTLAQANMRTIQDKDRVDIIATNPPFGGEEERGVLNNFPDGMRTAETALLFFQYILAHLKRPHGRCGVVLPNGFLFGNGIASIIKKNLLTNFNLHTIVRLPVGTFAPYTSIPTNILFFEACAAKDELVEEPCTREVWYYEIPLPADRKSYSKTKPMPYEDFQGCLDWWENRVENEHAWRVPVEELLASDCNLDRKNPNGQKDFEHLPPEQLVKSILEKEKKIIGILEEIKGMLGGA